MQLAAFAFIALIVGAAAGCLSDLDAPLTCPVAPQVSGNVLECIELVTESVGPEAPFDFTAGFDSNLCVDDPSLLACYQPSRSSCACDASECADAAPACNPPPDCPAEVLSAHPGARCLALSEEDVGPFANERSQCLCGCERCLLACDGKGPIWSQIDFDVDGDGASDTPEGAITIDLQRHLADQGNLGVFVRARGITSSVVEDVPAGSPQLLVAGEAPGSAELLGRLPPLMEDRFDTHIAPATPWSWDSASERPSLIAIANVLNNFSLYEIDCIVPFVVE